MWTGPGCGVCHPVTVVCTICPSGSAVTESSIASVIRTACMDLLRLASTEVVLRHPLLSLEAPSIAPNRSCQLLAVCSCWLDLPAPHSACLLPDSFLWPSLAITSWLHPLLLRPIGTTVVQIHNTRRCEKGYGFPARRLVRLLDMAS
jgi:hypothetical protein